MSTQYACPIQLLFKARLKPLDYRAYAQWSADYLVVREHETRKDAPEDALQERVLAALRHKDDATRH